MIYNRALGLAEIQQINAYLNEKYSEKPEVTLESITVSGPTKTEYKIGEELDLTGFGSNCALQRRQLPRGNGL